MEGRGDSGSLCEEGYEKGGFLSAKETRIYWAAEAGGAVYLLLSLPRAYWLFLQVLIAPFIKRAIPPSKLGGIQR